MDPVICGVGVLLSVPLTLPAIGMAKDDVVLAFGLIFVGQIFLNMNWAIIVDVSLVGLNAMISEIGQGSLLFSCGTAVVILV